MHSGVRIHSCFAKCKEAGRSETILHDDSVGYAGPDGPTQMQQQQHKCKLSQMESE